jgi:hypothetical protein
MNLWFRCFAVLQFRGFVVSCFRGFVVSWFRGFVVLRFRGFVFVVCGLVSHSRCLFLAIAYELVLGASPSFQALLCLAPLASVFEAPED